MVDESDDIYFSNPNVTFSCTTSGMVLGTYNTGSLAVTSSGTWKQSGFYLQRELIQ
jgi:hypothetical protein